MSLVRRALSDLFTVTRTGVATYIGSDGLIKTAVNNTGRFEYDPVTRALRGLLVEDARTNGLLYSQDFSQAAWSKTNVTVGAAVMAPDGTMTAQKLTATAAVATILSQTWAATDTRAAFSVFIRRGTAAVHDLVLRNDTTATNLITATYTWATGVLTGTGARLMETLPGGWLRIELATNAGITAGNTLRTYAGFSGNVATAGASLYSWGCQVEAGAYATSYIPTTSATVTRPYDQIIATSLPWFQESEGTFFAEWLVRRPFTGADGFNRRVVQWGDGTTNNRGILYFQSTDGAPLGLIQVGAVNQATFSQAGGGNGVVQRSALAWRAGDFAWSANGVAALAGTVLDGVPVTPVTQLVLATDGASGNALNGYLRAVKFWPRRLSNAELQLATAA